MKSALLFVTVLALEVTNFSWLNPRISVSARTQEWTTREAEWTTGAPGWTTGAPGWTTGAPWWTTERPAQNLQGKMFTLSSSGEGRISLYRRFYSTYPRLKYPPWTTPAPSRGVTVCLRYIIDYLQTRSSSIFTLSPSSTPLNLGVAYGSVYWLSCDRYTFKSVSLRPSIRIPSYMQPDVWTTLCLTVDTRRNVAQVFSGSNMSIRKFLPNRYMWSGEGKIEFSGFDGQVTDVQVWDYPLRYAQVYNYMTSGIYTPRGSVLSWSYIAYSLRGKVVLEDDYRWQEKEPASRSGSGRQLKTEKSRRVFNKEMKNILPQM